MLPHALAFLALLAVAAAPVSAGEAPAAHEPADFRLLHEPLEAYWRDRLVAPLLERLSAVGDYQAAAAVPAGLLDQLSSSTRDIGLVRRSTFVAAGGEGRPFEALEIGPAACLMLAVRDEAPWREYGDLALVRGPLVVQMTSDATAAGFAILRASFPLAAELQASVRPLRVAAQQVAREDAQLLVFEVPRRSSVDAASDAVRAVLARGLRLIAPPAHLAPRAGPLVKGEVIVGEPGWIDGPPTVESFCDPYALVLNRGSADELVFQLYEGRNEALREAGSGVALVDRMRSALSSLWTMVRTWAV